MKRIALVLTFLCCLTAGQALQAADRGFTHPGGLHTQADFDRIRQQLADGHPKVTAAYEVLKKAAYAQSTAATYPAESIVRGGSGENYINAARGATIAYQNALRWKIEGNEACAKHAVSVLMAWCNTTRYVTGTSDQCLARGLYGYEFAQAAELMRDYEGWAPEDFHRFQRWMLDVWYPGCIHFLRNRNGTWENTGKWWQAPGHYWSNWGLCNALAVISIGILCDDVFIYNQGMSFIKYDQCGTFTDPRTANPILNDGLTEFWGNLIVTTAEWEKETGAYGRVGQMNESGRDTGHAAMALGLAVDIAHTAWNQGDDLFAYMNHRLAAGIEYVAAQCQEIADLPWTNYHYANNGYYYTDSRAWLMTGPALGAQIRAYWGTVIGHYEGIKGVKMPFSEWAYTKMGIDDGGTGGTSGDYDHLGYSVLMNTYGDGDFRLNPTPPVELQPRIQYNGKTIEHNELGGLTNTFTTTAVNNRAVAQGTQLTLIPRLPENEENTGQWQWNTGETTQQITVTADRSFIYRVTYTAANGTTSALCFPIAVLGDTHDTQVTTTVSSGSVTAEDSIIVVKKGASVTLTLNGIDGYGNYGWENNKTTASITLTNVKETQTVSGYFQNQGGRKTWRTFTIYVNNYEADNSRTADDGKYRIHHIPSDTYLTNASGHAALLPLDETKDTEQAWELSFAKSAAKYYLVSLSDNKALKNDGTMYSLKTGVTQHNITFAQGCDLCIFSDKNGKYWFVDSDANLSFNQCPYLYDFPFELVPYTKGGSSVSGPAATAHSTVRYTSVSGITATAPTKGITIAQQEDGTVRKVITRK